jgi:putative GTP pyrophosphokinase
LFKRDVALVSEHVERFFAAREARVKEPELESEFSYFGKHYILALPKDVVPEPIPIEEAPEVFELQIKTLFQHAWSEANHDLGYKSARKLTPDQKRLIAFSSAQAWGADRVFDQLLDELVQPDGRPAHLRQI